MRIYWSTTRNNDQVVTPLKESKIWITSNVFLKVTAFSLSSAGVCYRNLTKFVFRRKLGGGASKGHFLCFLRLLISSEPANYSWSINREFLFNCWQNQNQHKQTYAHKWHVRRTEVLFFPFGLVFPFGFRNVNNC